MADLKRFAVALPILTLFGVVVLAANANAQTTIRSLGQEDFYDIAPDYMSGPLGFAASNFLTMWTANQLGNSAAEIVEFGWQFRYATTRTYTNVKYWMGYTSTLTPISTAYPFPAFSSQFNSGPPPVLVYDGPLTASTPAVQDYHRVPIVPFLYNGTGNLCVLAETTGGSGGSGSAVVYNGLIENFVYVASSPSPTPSAAGSGRAVGASFALRSPALGTTLSVSAGQTGTSTDANATVMLPLSFYNPDNAPIRELRFSVNVGSPSLVFDNYSKSFGSGVSVTATAIDADSVGVVVGSATPLNPGKVAELRYRVQAGGGSAANEGIHSVGISELVMTNTASQIVPGSAVSGSITLARHRLTLGSVTAATTAMSEFQVPVSLANLSSTAAIASLQFRVSFAAGNIEFLGITLGSVATATGKGTSLSGSGSSRTIYIGGNSIPMASGELIRLKFRIGPGGASPGAVEVAVSELAAYDGSFVPESVLVFGQSGTATLLPFLPSDVNQDSSVDVVDVQTIVNLILSLQAPQYPGQGDVNGDNAVDVVDVQNVVNAILSP